MLVTLRTLTRLSAHTLVDVPVQVDLLLTHLNQDPRKAVMRQILADLRFLATDDRAHLWSKSNIESLLNFASTHLDEEGEALVGSLSILCDLVKATSVSKVRLLAKKPIQLNRTRIKKNNTRLLKNPRENLN